MDDHSHAWSLNVEVCSLELLTEQFSEDDAIQLKSKIHSVLHPTDPILDLSIHLLLLSIIVLFEVIHRSVSQDDFMDVVEDVVAH